MLLGGEANGELLVSGTARIVRHEIIYVGNVLNQCAETVENLRVVLRPRHTEPTSAME